MCVVVKDFVSYIGISDDIPDGDELGFITQTVVSEKFTLPEAKPDIEQLISVAVDVEIIDINVVATPEGTSLEGQILQGAKVVIEGNLRQKIKYVADEPTQSVHAAHNEKRFSATIIGSELDALQDALVEGRIVVTPYILDVYALAVDKRTIFKNIVLLIEDRIVS